MNTFFSGPPETGLSDITRAMLQDEANRNAAAGQQMQFFANLAGQRSQERQARGRDQILAGQTQSNERIAGMPYRGMTPAQSAQIDLEKRKQKFFEDHPELFGSDKSRIASADRAMELDQLTRESEAAAAMANAQLDQAEQSLRQGVFDVFHKTLGDWGNTRAKKLTDIIISGQPIPTEEAGADDVRKAKEFFDAGMIAAATKAQQGLGKHALLIRPDERSRRFVSVYGKGGDSTQGPPPPGAAAPTGPGTERTPTAPPPPPIAPAPAPGYNGPYVMPGVGPLINRFFGSAPAAGPAVVAPAPGPVIGPTPAAAAPPGYFARPTFAPRTWAVDPSGRLVPK